MEAAAPDKPPVGIVLDTTMGRSVDEVLALALLFGLDGKDEARFISLSITNPDLRAAALCEYVSMFYRGADTGPFARRPTIGMATDSRIPSSSDSPMIAATLPQQPGPRDIHKLNDTADPATLIRNALTSQYDNNCIIVLTGPATNLIATLDLVGGRDLIAQKVRMLCFVASPFNLKTDAAGARRLFAEWPTQIVTVGPEIGDALPFPGASIASDFAWSPTHPVTAAYRAFRPMPYDAPAPNMAAVLYAVRAKDNYFRSSEAGQMTIADDGKLKFQPSSEARHRSLIVDPAQKDRILKAYVQVASAKPIPRMIRFPGDDKKKQQAEKEAAAKEAAERAAAGKAPVEKPVEDPLLEPAK